MKVLSAFATLCLLGLAPAAHATSILGTWTCVRDTADNATVSNVTFEEDGQLDALVNFEFLGHDQKVMAQARYRSDFTLENNRLGDAPRSAWINSFTIDGQDARTSDHAERLRASLLDGSDATAPVLFTSENYMIINADSGAINCVRM